MSITGPGEAVGTGGVGAGILEQAETQGVNYRLINRKLNLVQKHFIRSSNNFGDEKTIKEILMFGKFFL